MIRNKKVKKMDKKTRRIYQKNKREIVIAIGIIVSNRFRWRNLQLTRKVHEWPIKIKRLILKYFHIGIKFGTWKFRRLNWAYIIMLFLCTTPFASKSHVRVHVMSLGCLILGDPGAVSQVGRKGGTKVFKYGQKSPWVPTLTELFPKIQADAGSWLGTKNALYYCAQSENSFSWVLFVRSYTTAIVSRLVWLMRQRNARSHEETFSLIKNPRLISNYFLPEN